MRMRDIIGTFLQEGKVERHPLKNGEMTVTVIDPTREQFVSCLKKYDDQTARFVIGDHLAIGDHYYWTHYDLANAASIDPRVSGWLAPWSVVVWGVADINDFEREDEIDGLTAANQPLYDFLTTNSLFKSLYAATPKIGFTCNEGLMIVFHPDGRKELQNPDITLVN